MHIVQQSLALVLFALPVAAAEIQIATPGPQALVCDVCNAPYPCTDDVTGCNDGNPCTDDQCDPLTGQCLWLPDPSNVCSDGNACTDDQCDPAGACVATADASNTCDDGNACTNDACSAAGLCVGTPDVTHVCDDANPCTSEDHCLASGACAGVPNPNNTCSDGKVCTFNDHCTADGQCVATLAPTATMCYAAPVRGTECGRQGNCDAAGECQPGPFDCDPPDLCRVAFCAANGQVCNFAATYDTGTLYEVTDLRFASDGRTLTWARRTPPVANECPASSYVIVSGPLSTLPVGSNPASESCATGTQYTFLTIPAVPEVGQGRWYLVRGLTTGYAGTPYNRWGPLGEGRATAACH